MEKQCSVCGHTVGNSRPAIAGPNAILCRPCHESTAQLLQARSSPVLIAGGESASIRRRCSFCGKREREVTGLVVWPQVALCEACVTLCAEIFEELDREGAGSAEPAT